MKPVPVLKTLKRFVLRFAQPIRAQAWLLGLSFLLVIGAVVFRVAEPWPLKWIFDGLIGNAETPAGTMSFERVGLLAAAFVALVASHSLCSFLSKMAIAVAFRRILRRVRADVFEHLQHMSILRYRNYRLGDLANRLCVDIDRLRLAGTNNSINITVNFLTMISMFAVMFWLSAQLALITIAIGVAYYLLARHLTAAIVRNTRRFRASDGDVSSATVEILGAVRTVQSLSLYDPMGQKFETVSENNLNLGLRGTILKSVLRQSVVVLFAFGIGLIIWRGTLLVQAGALTPGDLIIFMAYLREGMEKPMLKFSANLEELARGIVSGERILDCLDEQREPSDPVKPVTGKPRFGAIELENVSFRYPDGRLVLDKVNLNIEPGERIAVIGASGSGKSTLLSLILRLVEPESGSIRIDGTDIRNYRLGALRESMTTVLQDSIVFSMTLRDNMQVARPDATDPELLQALDKVALGVFAAHLDQGLNTPLHGGGGDISGGQRQKLALARASLRDAPIMLLDEPTSALDPASRSEVEQMLFEVSKKSTVLLITHNRDNLSAYDRVYELVNGKLVDWNGEQSAENGVVSPRLVGGHNRAEGEVWPHRSKGFKA